MKIAFQGGITSIKKKNELNYTQNRLKRGFNFQLNSSHQEVVKVLVFQIAAWPL